MGTAGSKKADDVITEPRKAFSDDDIFRHSSKRGDKSKHSNYFNNQPLRPKSAKAKSQDSKFGRDGNKTPTNGKSSIWIRRSKREKADARQSNEVGKEDGSNSRNESEMQDVGQVAFKRLNKFHGSVDSGKLWDERFEEGGDQKSSEWSASLYRSYDCLSVNSCLLHDFPLSRSFNPLVASKLPFMLSYELKPSLVAQLSSIKSTAKDNSAFNKPSKTEITGHVGYAHQTSLPGPPLEANKILGNADTRYQVDVSRYFIDSKTAKRSSECSKNKNNHNVQDDVFHKELAKTLAKLVDKAGTYEYKKFCNMARAYSVDFSDVYIADFLESVETLAKLAKPLSSPTVTPTTSPYRRASCTPTGSDRVPFVPRTNLLTPPSTNHQIADLLWTTAGRSEIRAPSERSATMGPDTFSIRASRIPIPIGTKMIQRGQKDFQSNFITSPSARASRNGYAAFKHLPSVQACSQKEVLSAIDEVHETSCAAHARENQLLTTSSRVPSKCCCFCEESLGPVERMESEILNKIKNSQGPGQFDVDFFYVDKDTKKPTMSFEEVLNLKRNKRLVQIREGTGPICGVRSTSPSSKLFAEGPRSRRNRPVSLYLLSDSSDRYVPVARLTIRKRCTCEVQMRRLCTFLESSGCCLAEATIAECSFEPAAILRLSKAIEVNESLRILNLESCGLEDDFAMLFGAALRFNATLTRLSLAKNSIGPRGISYLNQGLAKNLMLQELSLDYNLIMDEGCKILSDLLGGRKAIKRRSSQNDRVSKLGNSSHIRSSLRKLSLKANKISHTGAVHIFLALRHVTNLTDLDLSGNQIEDASMEVLSHTLLFNRSLKVLKLDNCALTWKCCECLRRPLKTNTDLSVLSLDLNQLTDLGVTFLAEGLQYNRSIKELSLNMCSVTSTGLESIIGVIKSRTALRTLRLCYNDISIADNSNAGFVSSQLEDQLNGSFEESSDAGVSKSNQNTRTNQALNALDRCLRDSQKNLVEDSIWCSNGVPRDATRFSSPGVGRHRVINRNALNSSLYRKMMMALKRNPSLRIVMWGNQRTH